MGRLLKGALAHKVRLIHTAVAVALAVTLVSGTFALSGTIDRAFHQAATAFPNGVAVVVRSAAEFSPQASSLPEREPLPQSLLATVQAVPGVKEAWGTVWGYAQIVGKDGKAIAADGLPAIGSSWSPGDSLVAGRAPAGPGEVVIDEGTAKANGLGIGDHIKILFEGVVKEFVIGGLQGAKDFIGSTFASFDLQTTQTVLGQAGKFDQISVRAEAGVSPDELRARIAGTLPDRYEAVTDAQAAREAEKSWTKALAFLTTGLLVFAAIALLVSAFIIFNTFSILVAQRTQELGLLRALGASRRQVTASVLAEALAVGVVGSLGGVVLGFFAAGGLLGILRSTGFDVPPGSVAFTADMVVAGLVSGVLVTVLAASLPARRATHVSPAVGIASAGGEDTGSAAAMDRGRRLAVGSAVAAGG
ncbi:MAG: ABC transporter permease, partial [Acidimicrobiales bacterium]